MMPFFLAHGEVFYLPHVNPTLVVLFAIIVLVLLLFRGSR